VGLALRRALGVRDLELVVEPRPSGVSHLFNARRREVYFRLVNDPGIHLRVLSRALAIPLQSLRWHLAFLARAGLVVTQTAGGNVGCFAAESVEPEDRTLFVELRKGRRIAILRHLLRRGPRRQNEIVKALRTYQQAVLPDLRYLVESGLLKRIPESRGVSYRVSPGFLEKRGQYLNRARHVETLILAGLEQENLVPRTIRRGQGRSRISISPGTSRVQIRLDFNAMERLLKKG